MSFGSLQALSHGILFFFRRRRNVFFYFLMVVALLLWWSACFFSVDVFSRFFSSTSFFPSSSFTWSWSSKLTQRMMERDGVNRFTPWMTTRKKSTAGGGGVGMVPRPSSFSTSPPPPATTEVESPSSFLPSSLSDVNKEHGNKNRKRRREGVREGEGNVMQKNRMMDGGVEELNPSSPHTLGTLKSVSFSPPSPRYYDRNTVHKNRRVDTERDSLSSDAAEEPFISTSSRNAFSTSEFPLPNYAYRSKGSAFHEPHPQPPQHHAKEAKKEAIKEEEGGEMETIQEERYPFSPFSSSPDVDGENSGADMREGECAANISSVEACSPSTGTNSSRRPTHSTHAPTTTPNAPPSSSAGLFSVSQWKSVVNRVTSAASAAMAQVVVESHSWWFFATSGSDQTKERVEKIDVKFTESGMKVLAIPLEKGYRAYTVTELKEPRYDASVPRTNCFYYSLTVDLQSTPPSSSSSSVARRFVSSEPPETREEKGGSAEVRGSSGRNEEKGRRKSSIMIKNMSNTTPTLMMKRTATTAATTSIEHAALMSDGDIHLSPTVPHRLRPRRRLRPLVGTSHPPPLPLSHHNHSPNSLSYSTLVQPSYTCKAEEAEMMRRSGMQKHDEEEEQEKDDARGDRHCSHNASILTALSPPSASYPTLSLSASTSSLASPSSTSMEENVWKKSSSLWGTIAFLLDHSVLCKSYPSVALRTPVAKEETTTLFLVIRSSKNSYLTSVDEEIEQEREVMEWANEWWDNDDDDEKDEEGWEEKKADVEGDKDSRTEDGNEGKGSALSTSPTFPTITKIFAEPAAGRGPGTAENQQQDISSSSSSSSSSRSVSGKRSSGAVFSASSQLGSGNDAECAMVVLISREKEAVSKPLRYAFALILPLLVVLAPLPFFFRYSTLLQELLEREDFGHFLYAPPKLLTSVFYHSVMKVFKAGKRAYIVWVRRAMLGSRLLGLVHLVLQQGRREGGNVVEGEERHGVRNLTGLHVGCYCSPCVPTVNNSNDNSSNNSLTSTSLQHHQCHYFNHCTSCRCTTIRMHRVSNSGVLDGGNFANSGNVITVGTGGTLNTPFLLGASESEGGGGGATVNPTHKNNSNCTPPDTPSKENSRAGFGGEELFSSISVHPAISSSEFVSKRRENTEKLRKIGELDGKCFGVGSGSRETRQFFNDSSPLVAESFTENLRNPQSHDHSSFMLEKYSTIGDEVLQDHLFHNTDSAGNGGGNVDGHPQKKSREKKFPVCTRRRRESKDVGEIMVVVVNGEEGEEEEEEEKEQQQGVMTMMMDKKKDDGSVLLQMMEVGENRRNEEVQVEAERRMEAKDQGTNAQWSKVDDHGDVMMMASETISNRYDEQEYKNHSNSNKSKGNKSTKCSSFLFMKGDGPGLQRRNVEEWSTYGSSSGSNNHTGAGSSRSSRVCSSPSNRIIVSASRGRKKSITGRDHASSTQDRCRDSPPLCGVVRYENNVLRSEDAASVNAIQKKKGSGTRSPLCCSIRCSCEVPHFSSASRRSSRPTGGGGDDDDDDYSCPPPSSFPQGPCCRTRSSSTSTSPLHGCTPCGMASSGVDMRHQRCFRSNALSNHSSVPPAPSSSSPFPSQQVLHKSNGEVNEEEKENKRGYGVAAAAAVLKEEGVKKKEQEGKDHLGATTLITAVHPTAAEPRELEKLCRICQDGEEEEDLIAPCECTGTVRWIHRSCLDLWRLESVERNPQHVTHCELCHKPFTVVFKRTTILGKQIVVFGHFFFLCAFSILIYVVFSVGVRQQLGEFSCMAFYHSTLEIPTFSVDGVLLFLGLYPWWMFIIFVAKLIVQSYVLRREDAGQYMGGSVSNITRTLRFWSVYMIIFCFLVFCCLALQALLLGYLFKYFLFATSQIPWSWEGAPFMGSCLQALLLYGLLRLVRLYEVVREQRRMFRAMRGQQPQQGPVQPHSGRVPPLPSPAPSSLTSPRTSSAVLLPSGSRGRCGTADSAVQMPFLHIVTQIDSSSSSFTTLPLQHCQTELSHPCHNRNQCHNNNAEQCSILSTCTLAREDYPRLQDGGTPSLSHYFTTTNSTPTRAAAVLSISPSSFSQDSVQDHLEALPLSHPTAPIAHISCRPAPSAVPPPPPTDVERDERDVDFTAHFQIPPEQRIIRAYEYCPPTRKVKGFLV